MKDQLRCQTIAGSHVREILGLLRARAHPGIMLIELENFAWKEIEHRNLVSSFKGYAPGNHTPYPSVLCTSVNDEVGHVPPSASRLKDGDILSVDFAVSYDEFHADAAQTWMIGNVDRETRRLVNVTRRALEIGIKLCRAGTYLREIGGAIETFTKEQGYSIVKAMGGHGIGLSMHEDPWIGHFADAWTGGVMLEEGMVICLEPMVNAGGEEVKEDGWKILTVDGSLSAHWEHTIVITSGEPQVLT
jgi:methionyl aminopeptidase